jgi:hypothetical protein
MAEPTQRIGETDSLHGDLLLPGSVKHDKSNHVVNQGERRHRFEDVVKRSGMEYVHPEWLLQVPQLCLDSPLAGVEIRQIPGGIRLVVEQRRDEPNFACPATFLGNSLA